MSQGPTVLFTYDILREDEKLLLRALKELARVNPIHIPSTPLQIGNPNRVAADIALVRGVSGRTALYGAIAVESWGIRSINTPESIMAASDKAYTHLSLSRKGVPQPRTLVSTDPQAIPMAVRDIGYPAVVKPVKGSWGRLVNMVRDEFEAQLVAEHRSYLGVDLRASIIQEYVEKPGRDIRTFCVGGEAPAGIYRELSGGFATNIARGARASPVRLDRELEDLTLRSCEAVGVEVGGVDIVEDLRGGYVVLEVNPVPEFKTTQRVTGVDMAGIIAGYVVSSARR
ncbi:MAG: lysine biosynthesis protein LysX [Aeropyrum sp.]|nr:lysine biosynthesis protein LysX [Aeropyrum sp.]